MIRLWNRFLASTAMCRLLLLLRRLKTATWIGLAYRSQVKPKKAAKKAATKKRARTRRATFCGDPTTRE